VGGCSGRQLKRLGHARQGGSLPGDQFTAHPPPNTGIGHASIPSVMSTEASNALVCHYLDTYLREKTVLVPKDAAGSDGTVCYRE
jgi:hypothetical protein